MIRALRQRLRRRNQRTVPHPYRPLAHPGESAVGEGREVAGAAQRAVLVHHRRDPRVQHRRVHLHRLLANPRAAGGQGGQPEQHQRPHHLALDLRPEPAACERTGCAAPWGLLLARDVRRGERPEPGGHPVVRHRVARQPLDDTAARRDPVDRCVRQHDRASNRATATTSSNDNGPAPTVTAEGTVPAGTGAVCVCVMPLHCSADRRCRGHAHPELCLVCETGTCQTGRRADRHHHCRLARGRRALHRLARRLNDAGHTAVIATHEPFRALVEARDRVRRAGGRPAGDPRDRAGTTVAGRPGAHLGRADGRAHASVCAGDGREDPRGHRGCRPHPLLDPDRAELPHRPGSRDSQHGCVPPATGADPGVRRS